MKQWLEGDCTRTRAAFSGYLDGAVPGKQMQAIAAHLDDCRECHAEFAQWRGMQQLLTETPAIKPPNDLGLQLRLAISHEKSRHHGWRLTVASRWENLLRPIAIQAAAGCAGALLLLGSIAALVGIAPVANPVLANGEPLRAVTAPRYLYSAARQQPIAWSKDSTVVVEADVNAEGKVYDFHVISGPLDERTRAEIVDKLMLQIYEPARMFGQPVRGRVVVAFSGVSVRG